MKENEKQWYVINTYSGHENKVKANLEKRIASMNMGDFILQVLVAEHEEPVIKDGVPTGKTKLKNTYPGYVFVEMIMSDEAWFVVRNTPNVTGFVGSSGRGAKPFPVPKEQIEPVLKRLGIVDDSMFSAYNIGDEVRILLGTFVGSTGFISAIDHQSKTVSINTIFFGRAHIVTDIAFTNIEKIVY